MMYISVVKKLIKKYVNGYEFLWYPMALLEIPSCRPGEKFVIDCCISDYAEEKSISRFFLINKVPGKLNIVYAPLLRVPQVEKRRCTLQEFISDVNHVIAFLSKTSRKYMSPPIKPSSLWKTALTSLFFPFKLVFEASSRQAEKMGNRLKYSVLKEILETLCLDRKPLPRIKWEPVYILMGIAFASKRIALFFGDNVIRARAYEKYVFRKQKLADILKKYAKKINIL